MRWTAELSCLLPYFGRRIRPAVLPDHCGTGAKPAYWANAGSAEKRVTSAVSPTILAAVSARRAGHAE